MVPISHRCVVPVSFLIGLCGLMLALVPSQHAAPVPDKARSANSPPSIYALLAVGKGTKYRKDREHRKAEAGVLVGKYSSPFIALRAEGIANLKVLREQKDPLDWLKKNLRADYLADTAVLRLSLTGGSADEQIAIINAVLRTYLRFEVDPHQESRVRSIKSLRKSLDYCAHRLHKEEAELIALNKAVPRNEGEQLVLVQRRNRAAKDIARLNKAVQGIPVRIEELEAEGRALPFVLKWAE